MKLLIVLNDGTLLEEIKDLEDFNLDSGFAQAEVIREIKRALENHFEPNPRTDEEKERDF